MRIFKETQTAKLPKHWCERFFVQSWHSMVHHRSLDSHRVQCMYSLNILRELDNLLSKDLPGIEEDIHRCAEEALLILSDDKIVQQHIRTDFETITTLLNQIKADSKGKQNETRRARSLFSYYLKDFLEKAFDY